MKLSRTLVFTLLFLAAVAVYIYQVRLGKEILSNIPDEVDRSVAISPSDTIQRIELRDHVQKTQIALKQEKGTWMLEIPVRYPAENQIAGGLVTAARMAARQSRLRAEKEWDEYGLAKPEIEVLFDIAGKKTATLLIGSATPVGKAVFARWTQERGYFLLPAEMKGVFRQSVYGLREKRIFRVPFDDVRSVFLEMGENHLQWKKDGKDWFWFEPVAKFGQKVPVLNTGAMLGALQNLHVREFQDNNTTSRAELGFFMIHDLIRVGTEDGKTETFYFGNEVPERNAYYGLREGEDTVFFVDREKIIELLDLLKAVGQDDGDQKLQAPSNKIQTSSKFQ